MEFKLDFEYDEDVVKMYYDSLCTTFTNEGRTLGKTYTIEQTRTRLYESSKSKNKNGFDLLGFLKVYDDNNKLVALSFPRKVIPREYDLNMLSPLNDYYRLSGIYVSEEARGQGIALKTLQWFMEQFKFVLWTADEDNHSSIRVAEKANLKMTVKRPVLDPDGNYLFTVVAFSN